MRDSDKTAAEPRDKSGAQPPMLTPRIYMVMAATTVSTFATLMTGYQIFFPPYSPFA
jgi:hypothetical protein